MSNISSQSFNLPSYLAHYARRQSTIMNLTKLRRCITMCITKLGGVDKMFSVRLPEELEKKLNILSKEKNTTKSEIVKEALAQYIAVNSEKLVSYDLGKEFFGRYGSGDDNRSETYKKKLKEKFHGKNTR